MTEVIKDKHYNIIGYITTDSNGKKVLKNTSYKICGYYDPHTNVTKDASFRIVGYGNLLMSLI